jgi:regulator of cell morphogenesis and NO signaling
MKIEPGTLVTDIVTRYPTTIPALERLGIDYCCGGRIPLADACQARAIDTGPLIDELTALARTETGPASSTWQSAPLGTLIDHIVVDYHEPMRRDLGLLDRLLAKVVSRHGERFPELLPAVAMTYEQLRDELLAHARDEETVCFPHIHDLEGGVRSDVLDVRAMLPQLTREHLKAGFLLKDLRTLTNDYTPPAGVCPTFQALFAGLEGFERNLHRHVHLENNVLFPRAMDLTRGGAQGLTMATGDRAQEFPVPGEIPSRSQDGDPLSASIHGPNPSDGGTALALLRRLMRRAHVAVLVVLCTAISIRCSSAPAKPDAVAELQKLKIPTIPKTLTAAQRADIEQAFESQGKWFAQRGCIACHTISVYGVKGVTPIGPDLSIAVEDVRSRFGRSVEEFLEKPTGTMEIVLGQIIKLSHEERKEALEHLHAAYDEHQRRKAGTR